MKMHLNLNGGKRQSCRAMHLKKTMRMYLLYCRERQAIYGPVEPGKGWAFQSSPLRNFSPPECHISPRITEPASLSPFYEASWYDRQPVTSKHCLACLLICIFLLVVIMQRVSPSAPNNAMLYDCMRRQDFASLVHFYGLHVLNWDVRVLLCGLARLNVKGVLLPLCHFKHQQKWRVQHK